MGRQREFAFRTWGGKRKGAGRKPKGERAGVEHVVRPTLPARFPVHVTWRLEKRVWNLRTQRCFGVMRRAVYAGAAEFGVSLVDHSGQGDPRHLILGGPGPAGALGRGAGAGGRGVRAPPHALRAGEGR